jgi:branched-subunit amino acid aminotransferase/4-amino-4-deoxychorismate lyase
VLAELAPGLGIPWVHRDVTLEDVASADEVILSSTSPCLLPVVSFNRRSLGGGRPGDVFRRALAAWSTLVQLDIAGQARQFRTRLTQ